MTPAEDAVDRERDEIEMRVLLLAGRGWGLGDIATDTELEPIQVIELLYENRDAFRAEWMN